MCITWLNGKCGMAGHGDGMAWYGISMMAWDVMVWHGIALYCMSWDWVHVPNPIPIAILIHIPIP